MQYITLRERPRLRAPILIAAFAGWNDAAMAATSAAEVLVQRWRARPFADLDPEEFYDFTETRPTVRVVGRSQRRIEWPANTFFAAEVPESTTDFVILVGIEPQLRWKTYVRDILALCREVQVSSIITLGALLADVPHTRPPRVSGSSNDAVWLERLRVLGMAGGRPYQGPTGIVGVLNTLAGQAGFRTASLWGHVPHYLQGMQNPRIALAILQRLSRLLDLALDLQELERVAIRFDAQVAEAVAQNPEAADYVRQLEAGTLPDEEEAEDEEEDTARSSELPSGDALIKDLEDFLRRRRGPGSGRTE